MRCQGGRKYVFFILLLINLATGCRTIPSPPPIDFSAPGWKIRQGQAVWRRGSGKDLAGELLLATNTNGNAFVQFAKPPITLLTAQSTPNSWLVRYPPNHKYSGSGLPPSRLIWLYLPKFIGGAASTPLWKWERRDDDSWRLENRRTGESLEGYLSP